METLDQAPFDVGPFLDSVLALARNLAQKAAFLRDDINRRITGAKDALVRAVPAIGDKAQAAAAEAARALLGEAFILLPEFKLSSDALAEWRTCGATAPVSWRTSWLDPKPRRFRSMTGCTVSRACANVCGTWS
jgi:hypothetical protein